jgi:hypothetical protein
MPKAAPFEAHWSRYEAWFRKHEATFYSATEVERLALGAGFAIDACGQTLSPPAGGDPRHRALAAGSRALRLRRARGTQGPGKRVP